MKGLIKLFSAVAFVGTLASCSDDLSLNKNAGFIENADLYATLNDGDEDATRMGVLADKTVVWSKGDQIKVYSPDALKFNTYDLVAGEGTLSGSFELKGSDNVSMLDNKIAISSSEYLKGVYANEDGSMQLIATIPGEFNQNELVNGESVIYWPLKVPYYGRDVTFNGDGSLNATMNPLTALLKIDIAALPKGTKAIVLNTHFDAYNLNVSDDVINTIRTYNEPKDRAPWALGGKDEALSGTLTTKLVAGAKLVVDEDFKHADTLRVNIDELEEDQDKIIFVPIVAQRYEKLTVLAVTDDSKLPYFWPGAEVLKVYEDQEFKVNGRYTISPAAPKIYWGTSAEELSKFIAEQILNDGGHTINVLVPNALTGQNLFIANNLIPELDPTITQSSVNIIFGAKSTSAFNIVEAEANYNPTMSGWRTLSTSAPWLNIPTAPFNNVYSKDKKRTVTITFAEGEANDHNVILPTSNVILDADGLGIAGATIAVVGSNTKEVSGYTDELTWNTPSNHTNAGIVLKGSNINGIYEILPGQLGHIYAKGDGISDEIGEIQIDGTLIYPANIDLRVTDMLVKLIDYPQLGANAEGVIYTTGNAAIKNITEGHSGHGNTISVNASWTGKQLSTYALTNGYDQTQIYTAAQLQGMGRRTHVLGSGSPAKYEMNDRVRSVWLGASLFPWIGADVTMPNGAAISSAFEFNGKNCNLRNMVLDLYEPWLPVDCCCADNRIRVDANLGLISRVITTSTVKIYNVDLSDVLINTQKFVIPNIGAICGLIDATKDVTLADNAVASVRIDARGTNIGGAFGLVDSEAKVTVNNLIVDEASAIYGKSWVESESENVGGTIGAIAQKVATGYTYVDEVEATGISIKAQYVRSQDDNVGGQVGLIRTKKLNYGGNDIANNYVELDHEVYSNGGSNVGGLIGQADYQSWADHTKIRGTVFVRQRIQADINEKATNSGSGVNETGSNVGGLVGLDIIADALTALKYTEIEGSVSTKVVKAENRNAGGFVGYYEADDLLTQNEHPDADDAAVNDNTVTISQLLEATEGYVGGLYGYIRTANFANIGTKNSYNKHMNVTIGEIKGAKAVGGLIGATTENGNVNRRIVRILNNVNDKINIDIAKWTISKYPWFFRTTGDRKMNGSFGTVIGWLNGRIDITDGFLTIAEKDGILKKFKRDDGTYGGPDFESKNPIFTDAKKVNLLFILQKISQSTEGVEADFFVGGSTWEDWFNSKEWVTGQGLFYWGDENGYVGVNNNSGAGGGSYILNEEELRGNVNYNLYYDWSTPIWQDELPINYSHD